MTTINGQIVIRADDGDLQVEPWSVADTDQTLVTFSNTAQTFCVNRKPGQIVDIGLAAAGSTTIKLRFIVNGKDTGVSLLQAGFVVTVNNRLAATIPVAKGAAIQIKATV